MTFMDFCAGIGGGRLGLNNCGATCVAHSEIDPVTNKTYRLFFGEDEQNFSDLMTIDPQALPDFQLLIAGFPCQTFSVVGKREGFADSRGQIIYGLIKILVEKDVPYFILENVKGLVNHNKGKTLKIILQELSDAGYHVEHKVLNSEDYGVPQFRERIYFIGIKKELMKTAFQWPEPIKMPDIRNYLTDTDSEILPEDHPIWLKYLNNKYNKGKFDLHELLQEDYLVLDWRQSDLRLYRGKTPTLRTGRHGILYVKDGKLRKLSGYEGLLLQGFPKELAERAKQMNIPSNKLLSQAGNAMTVSVIQALGKSLMTCMQGEMTVDPVTRGSQTARNGFQNERDIAEKFNCWQTDCDAQQWLMIMQYDLTQIEHVRAVVLSGYKADINVQVHIKLKNAVDTENIQVKLVSTEKGFNQVDKRWLSHYQKMWNIPEDIYDILAYFTGEKPPYKTGTKNPKRMLLHEMEVQKQEAVINWFRQNKTLVLSDIIKGRGQFAAEWILVVQKMPSGDRWVLKNINEALQHYAEGDTQITPRGNIQLGRVGIQRKGGDRGRSTANMLQFKLNPISLFDTK